MDSVLYFFFLFNLLSFFLPFFLSFFFSFLLGVCVPTNVSGLVCYFSYMHTLESTLRGVMYVFFLGLFILLQERPVTCVFSDSIRPFFVVGSPPPALCPTGLPPAGGGGPDGGLLGQRDRQACHRVAGSGVRHAELFLYRGAHDGSFGCECVRLISALRVVCVFLRLVGHRRG